MFYPISDVQNANMQWYWTVDNPITPTYYPEDMIHDLTRSTVDGNKLDDYVLLQKYRMGRHFQVTTTTGDMAIAEILMTFAEMRKSRVQSDIGSRASTGPGMGTGMGPGRGLKFFSGLRVLRVRVFSVFTTTSAQT